MKKKRTKKLSQFLKSHISGTLEAISLKFGMWSAEGGGSVHSKHRLVSSRQHRATEVRKLRFLPSCQYTHGCCAPASWAARHTTVCLDIDCFPMKQIVSLTRSKNRVSQDFYMPSLPSLLKLLSTRAVTNLVLCERLSQLEGLRRCPSY